MQMKEIQNEILENKRRHNFNTTSLEQEFCYLYCEIREAYEAYCEGWDTFGEELADSVNFLMGIAEIKGIDLATEILKRMAEIGGYALQHADGIVMKQNETNLHHEARQMKDIQREIRENEVKSGNGKTSVEQRFCNLYGKVGEAYEAYYKNRGTFEKELANVAICIMSIAENNRIDLGAESVKKVQKNKSRVYKRNALGYMVHL